MADTRGLEIGLEDGSKMETFDTDLWLRRETSFQTPIDQQISLGFVEHSGKQMVNVAKMQIVGKNEGDIPENRLEWKLICYTNTNTNINTNINTNTNTNINTNTYTNSGKTFRRTG